MSKVAEVKGRLPNVFSMNPNPFITSFNRVTRVIRVDHAECPEFWLTIPLELVDLKGRLPNVNSMNPNPFIASFNLESRVIRVDHAECPEFWLTIPMDSVVKK